MVGNKGGAAIVEGGYGCIFKPGLKCKNSRKRDKGVVSKLIKKRYATEEYEHIMKIKNRIGKNDKLNKYLFLNNITMCQPAKLNNEDLKNIDDICEWSLKKRENKDVILSKEINNHIEDYRIINMPELGVSFHDFMRNEYITVNKIIKINELIVELLKEAIEDMNRKGVIHGDLKSSNILFHIDGERRGEFPVIIDWGLSYVKKSDNEVPDELYRYNMQFQHPFSTILFDKNLEEEYSNFLKKNERMGIDFNRENVRPFAVASYINFKKNHQDQERFIKLVFLKAYEGEMLELLRGEDLYIKDIINEQYYVYYFVNYIIDILIGYTDRERNKLDIVRYFNEVYMYNIDIWGLMSIYYELIDYNVEMYRLEINKYNKLMRLLMNILIKNIFTNGDKRIDVNKLVKEIRGMNNKLKYMEGGERGKSKRMIKVRVGRNKKRITRRIIVKKR